MNFSEERESWGEDDVLLDEVQLQTEAVDGHPVLKVAIEPVRLLRQDDPAPPGQLEEGQHLAELLASCSLGCLDVDELLHDPDAVKGGVVTQELDLGGERIAFSLLLTPGRRQGASAKIST